MPEWCRATLPPDRWPNLASSTMDMFSSVDALRDFISGFGPWAPVVFAALQIVQVVLAPVPGGVAVVVGTVLFGVWGGLGLSLLGSLIGSALLFAAVRRWGRPLAVRLFGAERVAAYTDRLDRDGRLLFVIMLVPFLPDDMVVGLAGLSAVSFRRFLVVVVLGRTPSWLLTALVTAGLATQSLAVVITVVLALTGVGAVLFSHRARLEAWLLRR